MLDHNNKSIQQGQALETTMQTSVNNEPPPSLTAKVTLTESHLSEATKALQKCHEVPAVNEPTTHIDPSVARAAGMPFCGLTSLPISTPKKIFF